MFNKESVKALISRDYEEKTQYCWLTYNCLVKLQKKGGRIWVEILSIRTGYWDDISININLLKLGCSNHKYPKLFI